MFVETPRIRIFTGPNGTGKSTIIDQIRETKVKDKLVDFGIYINADNIGCELNSGELDFNQFQINLSSDIFYTLAKESGLLNVGFDFSTI